MQHETLPGSPLPLGAELTAEGVNFSVFSRNGTKVFLNIYADAKDSNPCEVIEFNPEQNRTGDIWHIFVKGLKAGTLYLYQVDGPFDPKKGHRFNVNNLLYDPCTKAYTNESLFYNLPPGYMTPTDKADLQLFSGRELRKFPKCVVIDNSTFDWEGDKPINRPLEDSIIYETHLKGYTAAVTSGVKDKGTYKGFTEKIPYLKDLGVTAVELLPVQAFDQAENTNINPRTGERMVNYWGYSTVSFFAPKADYAEDKTPGGSVNEFKYFVKEMHKAGIEVILDVVYNHTAEGNEHGITINFRGFDNSIYYNLVDSHKEYYLNFSGCGNTFNCNHPVVQQYIIESLRYWVQNFHIDGFRFDLAPILGRHINGEMNLGKSVLNMIAEDPILHNTKIIAEPWDAGGGYEVGNFPGRWAEWNDRFRDDIRKFWRGDENVSTAAATRIAGSSDIFAPAARKPYNSINYVTCHDGFTLSDLVTYNSKHNEENGEENRDGSDNNISYNYGFEGPTLNATIERLRNQQIKNFILTTLISQGTPMLLAGDEFRRTQNGNNNAYCQDTDLSWIDWTKADDYADIVLFTKKAIALRKAHKVFRRQEFFGGEKSVRQPDIQWFNADGTTPDWNKLSRFLAFKLNGYCSINDDGSIDNDFFIAANPDKHDIMVTLPLLKNEKKWYRVADTSITEDDAICDSGNEEELRGQTRYVLPANAMMILIAK